MASSSGSALPNQEIDLRDYVDLFWKQRWLILAVCLGSVLAAFCYSLTVKPVYTSESKFIAKTGSQQGGSQLASIAKMTGFAIPEKEDQDLLSHIDEIIRNVDFLDQVLEKKWAFGKDSLTLPEIWKVSPDTTKPDWKYRFHMENVDRIRQKLVNLSDDKGLRVLTTNAESASLAYQINVFLIGLINDYMMNNVKSTAKENRLFIDERITEIRAELTQAENELEAFQKSNLNLSSPPVSLELRRLSRNVSINEEIYLQLKKEFELARIEEKKDEPLVIVVKKPEIATHRSKPNRKLIMLIGACFGLVFGFLAAAFRIIITKG